jgi:transposase
MMVKVLLYAYATGTFSSRRIARKIEEDVAYRVLAAELLLPEILPPGASSGSEGE